MLFDSKRVITNRDVTKKIKGQIMPILKDIGFSEFTPRNAWRYNDESVDTIWFQSFNKSLADGLGVTTFSLAVSLGKYFTWCPTAVPEKLLYRKKDLLTPDVTACPARKPLYRTIRQKVKNKEVWLITKNGKNLEQVIADIVSVIKSDAFPWFESLQSFSTWEEILLKQNQSNAFHGFGEIDSPTRNAHRTYQIPKKRMVSGH